MHSLDGAAAEAHRQRPSDGWLLVLSGAGTVCFLACYATAIALYPGGTWANRRAPGHSWSENFLCDLMQARALNGLPSATGSLLARLGIVAMLIALAAFYMQVARLETPVQLAGKVAQRAGLLACVLGCAIPIATSDRFRDAHIISVVLAFVPALVATVAAVRIVLRAATLSWWIRGAAWLTLAAGAIDGLLYAYVYASPLLGLVPASGRTRAWIVLSLPLFQRLASVGLLAWVAAMWLHGWRGLHCQRTPEQAP